VADRAATGTCCERATSVRHCCPVVFANKAHQARNAHDLKSTPHRKLGVPSHIDWRVAFAASTEPWPDFDQVALIALAAWEQVVSYVEATWQQHLDAGLVD
jgi:hypothetical protein